MIISWLIFEKVTGLTGNYGTNSFDMDFDILEKQGFFASNSYKKCQVIISSGPFYYDMANIDKTNKPTPADFQFAIMPINVKGISVETFIHPITKAPTHQVNVIPTEPIKMFGNVYEKLPLFMCFQDKKTASNGVKEIIFYLNQILLDRKS